VRYVEIYSDGACSSNSRDENGVGKGIGGWAAILVHSGTKLAISGYEERTTNNRCELLGVLRGLEALGSTRARVLVVTDSSYVKNAFTQDWFAKWDRTGWISSRGDPVANRDLWKDLQFVVAGHDVSWRHVRGHTNGQSEASRMNAIADQMAVAAKLAGHGETMIL